MPITLVSSWSETYQPLADITWPGKVAYAKKHGYSAQSHKREEGKLFTAKMEIEMFSKMLARAGDGNFMLYTGTDALIYNPEIKAESFIPTGIDLVCGMDNNMVFADAFLMRCCPTMFYLLGRASMIVEDNAQVALTSALSDRKFHDCFMDFGWDYYTPIFEDRAEKLLNSTDVRVKLLRSPMRPRFSADNNACHDPATESNARPHFKEDCFIFHMGGKTLDYRLKNMASYLPL